MAGPSTAGSYDLGAVSRSPLQPSGRPLSIAELAERALSDLWDPSRDLKYWLRTAQRYRNDGKTFADDGDYENAFIQFARAATIVLEKLPTHRDYHEILSVSQRHNLGLNGQDILDSLSKLKPTLVERHEEWIATHGTDPTPAPPPSRPGPSETPRRNDEERQRRESDVRRRAADERELRQRLEDMRLDDSSIARANEDMRVQQEEMQRQQEEMRRREEDIMRRRLEERRRAEQDGILRRQAEADAAASEARRGAPAGPYNSRAMSPTPAQQAANDYRRRQEADAVARRQQEVASEFRAPSRALGPSGGSAPVLDERRWHEVEGIARRQREADAVADALRHDHGTPPSRARALGPAATMPDLSDALHPGVSILPLESPSRYEEDTDKESNEGGSLFVPRPRHPPQQTTPSSSVPRRKMSYPPPITTTSPAPPSMPPIRYPSLMSQHQIQQGYRPSLHSMFGGGPSGSTPSGAEDISSLLFGQSQPSSLSSLYQHSLPQPSAPISQPPPSSSYNQQQFGGPSYFNTRPYAPPAPPPIPSYIPEPRAGRDPVGRELKTVSLPRDCLPRFLSIAAVNTARNRETCGLLLGKDRGRKFIVTTLLIPKQRATSDTCAMEEEELVLEFTEERSLITLGWIHTHPTQSCFMSSVDLHTHCGFQRMLPESFAVVCAPQHTPNFGIFRLTEPPGLQTILDCTAKEAFHPHPDVPIYTDADKGHVQMKDMSLEIVDLR